jgi:hypothetical protein
LATGLALEFDRLELERRRVGREADERAERPPFLVLEPEPLLRLLAARARLEPPFWERVELALFELEFARPALLVDCFFVCVGIWRIPSLCFACCYLGYPERQTENGTSQGPLRPID